MLKLIDFENSPYLKGAWIFSIYFPDDINIRSFLGLEWNDREGIVLHFFFIRFGAA